MNRAELERMDREALILRAEGAGVARARVLTRPELVDELLLRSTTDYATKQRARGLFGLARDLIARVVEQGLHLPDAAERIRAMGTPAAAHPSAPAALPTVTLAEIYAAQGHRGRSIETLEGVLDREPEHVAAAALLDRLRDSSYPIPPPRMPPEEDGSPPDSSGSGDDADDANDTAPSEPLHMLDDAPLPSRYDVDECIAIPVDPVTLYVYWEVRERTLEHVRRELPGGTIALRIVVIVPTWDGPESTVRDHDVHAPLGDYFVRDLPAGCVVRAAVGYRAGTMFVALAHSPALETPPNAPSPLVADSLVRWTPNGTSRISPVDRDAESILRVLGRVRKVAVQEWRAAAAAANRDDAHLGGSERWATSASES
jgi:hypothetical protein